MKNFLQVNQLFGTVGSPNQTGETQTRENRVGLTSYLHRTFMLFFAVLVMSVANIGMAWGAGTAIASLNFSYPSTMPSGYTLSSSNTPVIASTSIGDKSCIDLTGTIGAPTFSPDNSSAPTSSTGKRWMAFCPAEDCTVTITVYSNAKVFYLYNKDHYTPSDCVSSYTSAANVWDSEWTVDLTANTWYAVGAANSKSYIGAMSFVASGGGGATTYDVNIDDGITNGSVSASPTSAEEDETVTLTVTPSTGYELATLTVTGDDTGDEVVVDENEFSMPAEDVTVSATFSLKNYTVTLNNQSATSAGTENVTTTYNSNTNLTSAITKPTKTGYVFAGYFTDTNGTGVQLIDPAGNWIASAGGNSTYLDGSKNWKNDGDLTLYACWMEYCPGMDMAAEAIRLGSGEHKTWTNLTTNKILYSVYGNTTFDDSDDASNAYDGLKFKNNGDYILFLVQANSSLKLYFGYTDTKPKISINGGAESDVNVTSTKSKTPNQEVDFGTQTYDRLIKLRTVTSSTVVLQKIEITAPVVATCPDAYSFHYGTNGEDDWTTECFTKVGDHDWYIEDFEIPTTSHFYVGYEGASYGQTQLRQWTDTYSETNNIGNGAMVLRPTLGYVVGNAAGAVGTLRIDDNSDAKNQYVSFIPNGYGITYGGTGHAFSLVAGNTYETDLLTLPNCTTTYTMGLATATEGTYVTCYHSKAAEALSAPGNTMLKDGKKYIYLNAGVWRTNAEGRPDDVNEKMAVWDATNVSGEWGNGGNFLTYNKATGLYEGYVSSSTTKIVLTRILNSRESLGNSWGDNVNKQTDDITLTAVNNEFTITGWGDSRSPYTAAAHSHPATGDNGKFRMYNNSNDDNWYVHWVPYYILSYDGNGASGSTASQTRCSESSTTTVSTRANGFTEPTGYDFGGWATSDSRADAGTVDYAASASYTLSADATLYAVWSPEEYTITLKKGDHGDADQSATVKYDATSLADITHVTSTGYNLLGYFDGETKVLNANGSFAGDNITNYTTSGKWSRTSAATLTAKWEAKTTTVTFDKESGTGGDNGTTATYASAMTSVDVPELSGWVFAGYWDGAHGTGNKYYNADGTSAHMWDKEDASKTLYAKWEKDVYLNLNGKWSTDGKYFAVYCWNNSSAENTWVWMELAEVCSSPAVYKATIPSNYYDRIIFVHKNSNTLVSWDNKDHQSADLEFPGSKDQYTLSSADGGTDSKAEGSWASNYSAPTWTISFAGNDNTGGSMSNISSIACDANQAITANAFTKTGYSFAGWKANVDVKVNDETVTAGSIIANSATIQNVRSNITLTAQWSQIMVSSIALDPTSKTLTIDETQTITPTVLPTTALDKTVTWTTSDDAVATVDNGVVTAVGVGSATITATAHDGSEVYAECAITVEEAASCSGDPTALVSGTLYKVEDMASACAAALYGTGQYKYGLSTNGKFYVVGTTDDNNSSTGTVEMKTETNENVGGDDAADFYSVAYLKMAGSQNHHSIKFVVPTAGTLTVWGYTKGGNNGDLQIKPQDGDAVTLITHSESNIKDAASTSVTAGTYYILSNGGGAAIYGLRFEQITVPNVSGLGVDDGATLSSIPLSWKIPGICDLSAYTDPWVDGSSKLSDQANQQSTSLGFANDIVTAEGNSGSCEQHGVAFPISELNSSITGITSITIDCKGNEMPSTITLWGGIINSSTTYTYWDFDANLHNYRPSDFGDNSRRTFTIDTQYWSDYAGGYETSTSIDYIAVFANRACGGESYNSFSVREVRYHVSGREDIDHIVLMRKEGSAATDTTDASATRLYSGTKSHYTDASDVTGKNYYYTVFAVHASGAVSTGVSTSLTLYTITYNAGAKGEGSIAAGKKTGGFDFTLSSSTFTRDGYTQDGWSTSDGGDKVYNLGQTYTADADITLYPHWVAVSGPVITNGSPSGGTIAITSDGSTPILSAVTGSTVYIAATPSTGYNFTSWDVYKTDESGTKVSLAGSTASTSFIMPSYAVTVNASFAAKTYTVTLNGNGGSGNTANVTATYGSSSFSSSITNPTKTGYIFDGWYSGEGGTGTLIISSAGVLQSSTTYSDGSGNWTNDGAVTLYAKWTRDVKTAGWGAPWGGTAIPNATTSTVNSVTLNACNSTKGTLWSNESYVMGDGDSVTINLASGYYISAVSTAALFDEYDGKTKKLYIQFNSQSTYTNSKYDLDEPITLGDDCYKAWGDISTAPLASVSPISAGAQSAKIYCEGTSAGSNYLYRIVVEIKAWDCTPSSTITFAAGTGTGTAPQARKYCGTLTLPDEGGLSKEGYNFAGWNDGVATYFTGETYEVTEDVTFTAQWRDMETPLIIPTVTHLDATNYHYAPAFTKYDVDGSGAIKCINIEGQDSVDWKFKITPGYYSISIAYGAPSGLSTDVTAKIYEVGDVSDKFDRLVMSESFTTGSSDARTRLCSKIFKLNLDEEKTYRIVVKDTYGDASSHPCVGYINFTPLSSPMTIADDESLTYSNVVASPGTVVFDVKDDGNDVTCLNLEDQNMAEWFAYITPNTYTIKMLYGTAAWSTNLTFSIIDPTDGTSVYAPAAVTKSNGEAHWDEEYTWSDVDLTGVSDSKPYIIRVKDTYGSKGSRPKIAHIDFIPTKYELAWSSNGGNALTGDYTSGDVAAGVAIMAPDDPTRTGYDFVKWNSADDGSGNDFNTKMPLGNVTYYAQWTIQTFTITWQNDDGTTLETDEDVEYGETPSYNGSTPTKASTAEYTYTFDTWDPSVSSVTGDATYTATYSQTANNYTLTWDLAGGKVTTAGTGAAVDATGTPYSSVAYGSEITAPVVTKSGYDFAGWNVSPASTMPAANTTYTAQWADLYRVDYNAMTGSVDPSYATGSTSSKVTLPEPTKSGYDFLGWYNTAGTRVGGAGDKYGPTEAVTLYAKWQGSCSGTGTTIYKARIKTSGMSSLKSEIDALSTNTTLTTDNYLSELSGGTLTLALTAAGKASVANDSTINIVDKGKAYFSVTLSGTKKFQKGDIVTIGAYAKDAIVQKTTDYSKATDWREKCGARRSFVIPSSLIGENTFYIKSESNGMNFAYVDVYRPGQTLFFAEVKDIDEEANVGAAETEQTTSTYLASISGGKLYTKGNADSYVKAIKNTNEIQLASGDNNTYIKLVLDKKLAAGDKIIVNTSTTDKPFGITTSGTRSTMITAPYTIPAESGMIGEQTIYLWRNSSNSNMHSVAVIRPNVPCHTVTYDGNGATSGYVNDPVAHENNDFVIVSSNSGGFTRIGNYEFNGWNTKADGSGTDFDYYSYPNDHFRITQDTTLYAQWRMVVNTNTENLDDFDEPEYKDLRITNGATLTINKDDVAVRHALVETGSTLNIAQKDATHGVTFTVDSLTLKGGWGTVNSETKYDMPRVYIDPKSTLVKNNTTTNIVNFDIAVDNENYYPFALPFDVPLKIVPSTTHNEDPYIVDYANSTMAYYSKYYSDESSKWQYAIKTYNGQRRANYGGSSLNWEHVDAGTTLKAGRGYALTALPASGYGDYAVIRFPMVVDNDWTTAGELGTATISDKEVTKNVIEVTAYVKAEGETAKANKGWNLLGVPYMSCYQTSADMYDEEDEDAAAIMQGKFDFETNSFKEDEIRYVSVPTHDFSEYLQYNIEDEGTKLLPGWCFFVQVASSGNLTFLDAKQAASSSIDIYAPKREQEHKPTVKTGIILSGADASDKTTILVSDKYDGTEYEINADLEKMFGENSYTLATYSLMGTTRLAYNAMSTAEARNIIPIGYRAPADGEYTFAINPRYAENFEHVNLIDYETGFVTDLLQSTYTFATERTQNDERFALNVVTRQDVITDIGNGEGANGERTNGVQKVIINDKLYIIVEGKMYDAKGVMVK